MKARILAVMVCVMAVVNFATAVSTSTSTQLFFDDFTGTALDTSRWSIFVDENGDYHRPYVAGGLLYSQGYHTRIDSIPAFDAPETGQSVMARARIRLSGDDQKFGFAVNPNEHAGPITGYYFDTIDRSVVPPGREHYIRALAWFQPAVGSLIRLLDVEIPVTWYNFHEFAIERTPSEVIYSIDGQEVARVEDAFAGALPVGVWNDRWSLMQTDWVKVGRSEPECPPLPPHEPWSFVHITDTHIGDSQKATDSLCAARYYIKRMSPKPAFVLVTGDISHIGCLNTLGGCPLTNYRDFTNIMESIGIPYYPIPGNHDRRIRYGWCPNDGLGCYESSIDIPQDTTPLPLSGTGNYWFEKNGYLFIGLDTGGEHGAANDHLTNEQMGELLWLGIILPKNWAHD